MPSSIAFSISATARGLGRALALVLGLGTGPMLLAGCGLGPPPPGSADFYDPSTDRPDAPRLPSLNDVTFDNLRYWRIENQPGWETRAIDIDVVDGPASKGLALKMSFRDLGLDAYDPSTRTGIKGEAAFSFIPPDDAPVNLEGKRRIRFELSHAEPEEIQLQLGVSGESWNWTDVPSAPIAVSSMERKTIEFEIPDWAEGLKKTRRITYMLRRQGQPITGTLYVAGIEAQ